MRNPWRHFFSIGMVAFSVLFTSLPVIGADPIYKCVIDGKVSYTSDPAMAGKCPQTVIRDEGPKPDELTRILEEKRLRQEEDRRADEADRKEREIRARELEAEASARRARAAEEELLLLKQSQSYPPPDSTYPYFWGGGMSGFIPPRPGFKDRPFPPHTGNMPGHPSFQPPPPQAPPRGFVMPGPRR